MLCHQYTNLLSDYSLAVGICNQFKDATNGSQFETAMDWSCLIIAIIPSACESLCILPVLNILLGELFPTDIRNISVGIVMAVTYMAAYGNMMAYPMVSSANAFRELMFGYGAVATFMTVWAMYTVKETDKMSLVEIEKMFRRVQNSFRRGKNSFRRVRDSFRKQKVGEKETKGNKHSGLKLPELLESAPLLKD